MNQHSENPSNQQTWVNSDPDRTSTWIEDAPPSGLDDSLPDAEDPPLPRLPDEGPQCESGQRAGDELDPVTVIGGLVGSGISGTLCWLWTEGAVMPERPSAVLRWVSDHLIDLVAIGVPVAVVVGVICACLQR